LTGLDWSVLPIKKMVSCHTADSKPVKQEVNGIVILHPIVFPAHILGIGYHIFNIDYHFTECIMKKYHFTTIDPGYGILKAV
jgi:hypothetical protein